MGRCREADAEAEFDGGSEVVNNWVGVEVEDNDEPNGCGCGEFELVVDINVAEDVKVFRPCANSIFPCFSSIEGQWHDARDRDPAP